MLSAMTLMASFAMAARYAFSVVHAADAQRIS